MNEIWKDVVGYEGLYQVSSLGNVRVLERFNNNSYSGYMRKEKILSPGKSTNGYLFVYLVKNKKPKSQRIHRLVALAFILNPKNKPEVNHEDGNKLNNVYTNLNWATHSENMKHAYKTGLCKGRLGIKHRENSKTKMSEARIGSLNANANLTEQDVLNIRTRKKVGDNRREVYKDYKHLLTFGSFSCVWYYQNWRHVNV